MPDKSWIEQVVQSAVAEVIGSNVARMQSELAARVLREIEPQLSGAPEGNPSGLLKAVSSIQSGTTQREILRALLDGAARYGRRVALFVVKAGSATGWQARGFADSEAIKDFSLNIGSGMVAQALQARTAASGSVQQMDSQFLARFQAPANGTVLLLPLVLKEKVAALVYADSGTEAGGSMDLAALELLVITTSAWLEVVSQRKHSAKEESADAGGAEPPPRAASAAPSFSDPFAGQAPAHLHAPPPMPAAPVAAVATATAQSQPASFAGSSAGAATAVAPAPDTGVSGEDAEIHRKAQRFARLLVDEIKLYNQAKVAEGRKNRDLYSRLKEDIDKSFATYQKRYGNTVAANSGYFNGELVRSLAEDDISVMGANFQR